MISRRPRAYVAGPITSSGSLHENLFNGMKVGEQLRKEGIHPFIPHMYDLTMITNGYSVPWEEMLEMDENWIRTCDLLVVLPGESKGKNREMAFARSLHIPVFELKRNSLYDYMDKVNIHEGIQSFLAAWNANNARQPNAVSC